MATTRFARRRRVVPTPRPRRRVDIARASASASGLANGAVQLVDVLATYDADLGVVEFPPGATCVGLKYSLRVASASLATNLATRFFWGFLVGPRTLDAADLDPSLNPHLNWMEWGARYIGFSTAGADVPLVGAGDDGFRTVRSMRKLQELQETVWFAIVSNGNATTWAYGLVSSAAMKLA